MSYEITEEKIKELLEKDGEVRGEVFKTDRRFILDNKGEEGLKKVGDELEKMGSPITFKEEFDSMDFYPIGARVLSLIAISKVLDLDKEGVRKMGEDAPKFSFMVKFFIKYFISPEKIIEKAGEMWEKHYTVGKLVSGELDGENEGLTAHLYDIDYHPILCDYLSGYFSSILKMGTGRSVKAEEVKCIHKGDDHHQFVIKW